MWKSTIVKQLTYLTRTLKSRRSYKSAHSACLLEVDEGIVSLSCDWHDLFIVSRRRSAESLISCAPRHTPGARKLRGAAALIESYLTGRGGGMNKGTVAGNRGLRETFSWQLQINSVIAHYLFDNKCNEISRYPSNVLFI